jgi:hypothetical protein
MDVDVTTLLTNAALLMVVIERAVAQVKALSKTDLVSKPWPVISFAVSGLVVFSYQLYILEALLGHGPTAGPVVVGQFLDWIVSSATIAGGSAGIIDMMKALKNVKGQAKAVS